MSFFSDNRIINTNNNNNNNNQSYPLLPHSLEVPRNAKIILYKGLPVYKWKNADGMVHLMYVNQNENTKEYAHSLEKQSPNGFQKATFAAKQTINNNNNGSSTSTMESKSVEYSFSSSSSSSYNQ